MANSVDPVQTLCSASVASDLTLGSTASDLGLHSYNEILCFMYTDHPLKKGSVFLLLFFVCVIYKHSISLFLYFLSVTEVPL